MQITPEQKASIVKRLFSKPVMSALEKMGLPKKEHKEACVKQYSNGRTTHIGELTYAEATELNLYLYNLQQTAPAVYDPRDKQRKRIIALCRACGWEKPGSVWSKEERKYTRGMVADMERINNWVKINFKNNLNALSKAQLSNVIVAAENMERSHRNAVINHAESSN